MVAFVGLLLLFIAAVSALPADHVLHKYDDGLRYQYVRGPDGTAHLVDLWFKASDADETARYDPDVQNQYHLFTRANPIVSQPLVLNQAGVLEATNYDASKRTIVLLHGWLDTVISEVNTVLVPDNLDGHLQGEYQGRSGEAVTSAQVHRNVLDTRPEVGHLD